MSHDLEVPLAFIPVLCLSIMSQCSVFFAQFFWAIKVIMGLERDYQTSLIQMTYPIYRRWVGVGVGGGGKPWPMTPTVIYRKNRGGRVVIDAKGGRLLRGL